MMFSNCIEEHVRGHQEVLPTHACMISLNESVPPTVNTAGKLYWSYLWWYGALGIGWEYICKGPVHPSVLSLPYITGIFEIVCRGHSLNKKQESSSHVLCDGLVKHLDSNKRDECSGLPQNHTLSSSPAVSCQMYCACCHYSGVTGMADWCDEPRTALGVLALCRTFSGHSETRTIFSLVHRLAWTSAWTSLLDRGGPSVGLGTSALWSPQ